MPDKRGKRPIVERELHAKKMNVPLVEAVTIIMSTWGWSSLNGFRETRVIAIESRGLKGAKASTRVLCVPLVMQEREKLRARCVVRGDFFLDVPLYYPRLRRGPCIFHETIFSVVPPAYYPTRITLTRTRAYDRRAKGREL